MEKGQRGGADRERACCKPGQQTQPALLTAGVVVRIRLVLVLVVIVIIVVLLRGVCFRDKMFSSEMNRAAMRVWTKGQITYFLWYVLHTNAPYE